MALTNYNFSKTNNFKAVSILNFAFIKFVFKYSFDKIVSEFSSEKSSETETGIKFPFPFFIKEISSCQFLFSNRFLSSRFLTSDSNLAIS